MTGTDFDAFLKLGEKAEPLGDGYYIIQSKDGYRFGTDAVALAHFASGYVRKDDSVFDMCSGCGIIGIMLALARGCAVDGAELDEGLHDMSVRSCALNGLNEVHFINADIRTLCNTVASARYDAVVCNPPYYKADSKPTSVAPAANSEITVTFAEIAAETRRVLKVGGSFFAVHITKRMDEVLGLCADNGLTPKDLVVAPNGKTFLLRAVRGGKQGMNVSVKEF